MTDTPPPRRVKSNWDIIRERKARQTAADSPDADPLKTDPLGRPQDASQDSVLSSAASWDTASSSGTASQGAASTSTASASSTSSTTSSAPFSSSTSGVARFKSLLTRNGLVALGIVGVVGTYFAASVFSTRPFDTAFDEGVVFGGGAHSAPISEDDMRIARELGVDDTCVAYANHDGVDIDQSRHMMQTCEIMAADGVKLSDEATAALLEMRYHFDAYAPVSPQTLIDMAVDDFDFTAEAAGQAVSSGVIDFDNGYFYPRARDIFAVFPTPGKAWIEDTLINTYYMHPEDMEYFFKLVDIDEVSLGAAGVLSRAADYSYGQNNTDAGALFSQVTDIQAEQYLTRELYFEPPVAKQAVARARELYDQYGKESVALQHAYIEAVPYQASIYYNKGVIEEMYQTKYAVDLANDNVLQ